ncbi:MAG: glycosyltransferase [Verrucomicrobia bacterium]|nr:glycosyltransferase [Verrucomicrobiota bacterium]
MMHDVAFWLAALTLLLTAGWAMEFAIGNRSLRHLKDFPPFCGDAPSRVSVIIAARDEARNLESALGSVLLQDYPNLEIIAVNDRSSDDTGAILDRLSRRDARLRVVHLTELPVGWLGKNHAMQCGSERATGKFFLFTDADVVMAPATVSRALGCMTSERLDHLALGPRLTMPGVLLNMLGGTFALFFGIYARPWKAKDPRSRCHIGIGAFNLVRADAYHAVGGHRAIAMRPDDDMKLGKLLKKSGRRQELVLGDGSITVEWYSSVGEMARGLEKNAFAGTEYSLAGVVVSSLAVLLIFVWPVFALAVTSGTTRLLNGIVLLLLAVMYADNAGFHGLKRRHWIGLPLMALLLQHIFLRATIKTLLQNGIAWRGTHYPLADLKANKV